MYILDEKREKMSRINSVPKSIWGRGVIQLNKFNFCNQCGDMCKQSVIVRYIVMFWQTTTPCGVSKYILNKELIINYINLTKFLIFDSVI